MKRGNTYTPVVATLGYVLSEETGKVLLVHRNARKGDQHLGKYNGLGGKLRPDEDVVSCMRREILEESGLHCREMILRGTISWPGFGKSGEDWLGFVFLITRFSGNVFSANEEGDLDWYSLEEMHSLPMWEGDRYFLPLVFDSDPRQFHGVMPYRNGRPQGWRYVRL